jgi:hypothetical protein
MESRLVRLVGPVLLVAGLALSGCDSPAKATRSGATGPSVSPSVSPSATGSAPPGAGEDPSAAPAPAKPKVSKATLDYFFQIAFAGHDLKDATVAMWTSPVVLVHLSGTVSAAGRSCADHTVADFNALSATTKIRITSEPGDIELHIVPTSRFKSIEPHATASSDGFTYASWLNDTNSITKATVLVQSTGLSASRRCSLIRRQLTQAMGLLGGNTGHTTSIFTTHAGSYPAKYSALDKQLIKLLYSGVIRPRDDRETITREVTVA